MVNKITKCLIVFVSRELELSSTEEQIYEYCIKSIISKCTYFFIVSLYGIIIKQPLIALVYLSLMFPFRLFSGGAHCSHKSVCLIISYSLAFLSIGLTPIIVRKIPYLIYYIYFFFFSLLPIVLLSPVDNYKKRLSSAKKMALRKKTITMAIIISIFIILSYTLKQGFMVGIIAVSTFICGVNVICGVIINKKFKQER